jgi:hypothetical protein
MAKIGRSRKAVQQDSTDPSVDERAQHVCDLGETRRDSCKREMLADADHATRKFSNLPILLLKFSGKPTLLESYTS